MLRWIFDPDPASLGLISFRLECCPGGKKIYHPKVKAANWEEDQYRPGVKPIGGFTTSRYVPFILIPHLDLFCSLEFGFPGLMLCAGYQIRHDTARGSI